MMSKRKRILIVDDEVGFTRILKLNLHHTGRFTAECVNNPHEALAVARSFSPDLIFLDVLMPGVDGGTVARQFQQTEKFSGVPIVFLTAAVKKNEVASREGCIGGLPFIAKPVGVQEIVGCIERYLPKTRGDPRDR